jgi:hypothetical protein
MAARLRKTHQEDVRSKIQTSQLINRLTDHVFDRAEMTKTQVSAAMGLLRKTLPDLSCVELSGNPDAPIVGRIELVAVEPSVNSEG